MACPASKPSAPFFGEPVELASSADQPEKDPDQRENRCGVEPAIQQKSSDDEEDERANR
jgi:hypothetical protein